MDNNRNRRNMRRYNNSYNMNMRQSQNQMMNGYANTNAGNQDSNENFCPCHNAPNMVLAMGYVPWQHFDDTYEPANGLMAGTIFPELDKPFLGGRGCGCR